MTRPGIFALGIIALAAAWWGLLNHHAFYAHMTAHMAVVAVAAPLMAFGVAGGKWDPVVYWPERFSPVVASMLELAVVWLWHTPVLHEAARNSAMAMAAEQASFLGSGFLLWISVFGGVASRRIERAAIGIVALLLTLMHMTLLGALLALSPRPLFADHHGADMDSLADQELGGVIMIASGAITYMAGALYLAGSLLLRPRRY